LPAHKIGINLHHKKELVENWIRQSTFNTKVELFPEDQMLGTGGALKNAEVFLNTSTFLVHNSDIVSDIDLEKLLEFHLSSNNLVTLAVHDCPEFNKLEIDEKGWLKGILRHLHPHPNPPPSRRRELSETPLSIEMKAEES
jgi:NDP-sugar pyrophosphorylase family protein